MRVGLMAENPLESALIASGMVPTAMLEAYAPVYARAIVTATKVGVFEARSPTALVPPPRWPRPVALTRGRPNSC